MTDGLSGKFADLGPRMVTALVLGPVALGLLWLGGLWTMLLVAGLAGVLAAEWRGVTARGGEALKPLDYCWVVTPVLAVVALWALAPHTGVFALIAAIAAASVVDYRDGRLDHAAWGSLGGLVIGLGCMAFLWLRETDPFGVAASLWIVLVVVATDVGGYFAGRLIGGPKLWPSVSPKKTWAGLGGAVTLAVIAGGLFSWSTTGTFFEEVCTVSAVAAVLAQLGDMGESAVKRRFGVKDSGSLFPGHGGALDRFDGLIAATLVVAAVTLWRGQTVFIWS
ncbi:MAG: phosphatidate cytidylyltransferase [Pseudomonadota bacterium]